MLLVSALLWCTLAYGEKYAYPEQKIRARGIEEIQISGVKGHVKLKGHAGKSYRLRVKHSKSKRYEDWSLAVDRRGHTLYLEVSSAAYGAQWRKVVRRDLWPEFDVELIGPAKPVTVSWREGHLEYLNWSANVESSHLKGRLTVKSGVGQYTLQTGDSDVDISKMAGDLTLKGGTGNVAIEQVTGQVHLTWLAGQVRLNSVTGGGELHVSDSELKLASCEGAWTVNVARGKADIERCSGKLQAEGESAAWRLRASHDLETEIKSLSGPVDVEWKAGGAKVFLTSDSGSIATPKAKAQTDEKGRQVAEFKVGAKPFGQVFVRTQTGPIIFK